MLCRLRNKFNRAEALKSDKRANTVGFALTVLQQRLASSPEAIYQSLRRRRERLESRLRELQVMEQSGRVVTIIAPDFLSDDDLPVQAAVQGADSQAAAARAREIIMEVERGMRFDPTDREFEKLGYDIKSRVPNTGRLRFIEVKGRVTGADVITVTRNEILYSLNKPDDFILAMVKFGVDGAYRVHYLRCPFQREPDFGVTSVNYNFAELLARAGEPS